MHLLSAAIICIIDFMKEACSHQTSLFTDCCCLIARGQDRRISLFFLTKSLFTVDSTEGSFPSQGSGFSHYSPAEEIMTCRCSAVGRKLVFLFFFFIIILQSCCGFLQRPSSHPPVSSPTLRAVALLHHWKCLLLFFLELMSFFFLTFILSRCCYGETL